MTTQPGLPPALTFQAQRFNTVAEAQAKASFTILLPTYLPKNLRVVRVDYVVPPFPGREQNPEGVDWVAIFYEGDNGAALVIEQGNTGYPTGNGAPAGARGTVMVQGREAIWVDGAPTMRSTNPPQLGAWRRGILSLGWEPNTGNQPPLPRGFSLTTSLSFFDLDELVRIATSVQ